MYNFKKDWHTCTSRLADVVLKRDTMTCHFKEINGEFESAINEEWDAQHNKGSKKKDAEEGRKAKTAPPGKRKLAKFNKYEINMETMESLLHKGWITKIRLDPLNNIFSSSLDGMIHIHKIDDLKYKNLTFNLH